MGQRKNIPAFISLCLSSEEGTEGSDLLLHLGSPFFICYVNFMITKHMNHVLITHCPELDHSGSLYRFLHGWCSRAVGFLVVPWGRKLPAGLQSIVAVLSFSEREFWLCLGQDRVSNFPQQSMVIPVLLESCVVTKILLKQILWLSNPAFDISCYIGNGQSLAKIQPRLSRPEHVAVC